MTGRLRLLPAGLLLGLLLLASPWACATLVFASAAEEARFHALTAELRCVQCHNQSLADSDALIARDMRSQVLALMQQGHSDAQIRDWLVARYGDFVLYRPRLDARTVLLWLGPLLVLAAGALAGWRIVSRRARQLPPADQPPGPLPPW